MSGIFDFAPNSHSAEEIPPEEAKVTSFNGWDFTSRPVVPYKPRFTLTMHGMRWYLNEHGDELDLVTDPEHNAGRLRAFYLANRLWDNFTYVHEFLGQGQYRFHEPVAIPKGLPNANGLIPAFEITITQHNPSF